ncbi:MAG: NADH-quinone oxidoreductase subunit N [Sphingobacteriales bacterium]|nr:NADH-quinone oxidoreductase subunit N [Sphingobacteriales bacterium]MBI3717266.1 NADH-quinone oxidoreductase subunit N [Sphingobacteriales bacterium]
MNVIVLSAVWGVVMMFSGLFIADKSKAKYVAITGLLVLLVSNYFDLHHKFLFAYSIGNMLQFDSFGMIFVTIALLSTLLYVLLSGSAVEKVGNHAYEYFALLFFVLCGVGIAASYNNLLMLFLGIEIISIPLYILTGADKRNLKSNEASLKYFLMGSFSTGIMLLGIVLLYGATGTFSLTISSVSKASENIMISAGVILMAIALAFKVSAAPFHFWTPDVYDGAPTVFTSFMATVVKAAGFIAFVRLFENAFGGMTDVWQYTIALIIAATLVAGNITAVFQQSVKRMLAYSSISQAGFMLFAVYSINAFAKEGILLYAAAYCLATIGIFAVLIKMKDFTFEGFNGLAKQQPLLALLVSIFVLSLAGIPLTGGFLSKYYMVLSSIKAGGLLWLVITAMLCAAVSVYYYFRLIQAMYFKEGDANAVDVNPRFKALLVVAAVLIILLGVYPNALLLDWFHIL